MPDAEGLADPYALAKALKAGKDYDHALLIIKGRLEKEPHDSMLLNLCGDCLAEKGMYKEALDCYGRAGSVNFFSYGRCLAASGEYEKAIPLLQKNLKPDVGAVEISETHFLLSFCYAMAGDRMAAQEFALAKGIQPPLHLFRNKDILKFYLFLEGCGIAAGTGLAKAYMDAGQVDEALSVLERSVKDAQADSAALDLMGQCLTEKGRCVEALSHFRRAGTKDTMPLAKCLAATSDYGHAIRILEHIAAPEARQVLSFCHAMQGEAKAVSLYDRDAKLPTHILPEDKVVLYYEFLASHGIDVRYRLARAYKDAKMEAKAIPLLRDLIARFPNDDIYPRDLGECLMDRERFDEALEFLEKAVSLDAGREWSHFSLGKCLAHLGRYREALQHLEQNLKTTRITLSQYHTYFYMAICYLSLGEKKKAQECYRLASALPPEIVKTATSYEKRMGGKI